MFCAERAGFEPAKRFWRLHTFQACLFNHSSISPNSESVNDFEDLSLYKSEEI